MSPRTKALAERKATHPNSYAAPAPPKRAITKATVKDFAHDLRTLSPLNFDSLEDAFDTLTGPSPSMPNFFQSVKARRPTRATQAPCSPVLAPEFGDEPELMALPIAKAVLASPEPDLTCYENLSGYINLLNATYRPTAWKSLPIQHPYPLDARIFKFDTTVF